MKTKSIVLLWLNEADCFVRVPYSVVESLRSKGVKVSQMSGDYLADDMPAFEIQAGKVVA